MDAPKPPTGLTRAPQGQRARARRAVLATSAGTGLLAGVGTVALTLAMVPGHVTAAATTATTTTSTATSTATATTTTPSSGAASSTSDQPVATSGGS